MERVEMRPAKGLMTVRCPTCSGWVLKKRAKPEEEVAGDGALSGVGITKRPKTKPKPDEDKEMVADAGAKEEGTKKERRTKKEKSPKPEQKMVAYAGAKEEKTKKKRTKKVLSPKPDEKEMVADTGSEDLVHDFDACVCHLYRTYGYRSYDEEV